MMGLAVEGIYAAVESLGYMQAQTLRVYKQGVTVTVTVTEGREVTIAQSRGGACYR